MKNKCNFHRKVIKIQNLADRLNGRFKWLKGNSVKWKRVDKKISRIFKNQSSKGTKGWKVCAKTQRTEDGRWKPSVHHWKSEWDSQGRVGVPHTDSQIGTTFTPRAVVCPQRYLVPESQDTRSCYIVHGHPTQISLHHTMLLVFQETCCKASAAPVSFPFPASSTLCKDNF